MCSVTQYEKLLMDVLIPWPPKLAAGTCRDTCTPGGGGGGTKLGKDSPLNAGLAGCMLVVLAPPNVERFQRLLCKCLPQGDLPQVTAQQSKP